MTLEEAVKILNENNYGNCNEWTITRWEIVDPCDLASISFEDAIESAKLYQKGKNPPRKYRWKTG